MHECLVEGNERRVPSGLVVLRSALGSSATALLAARLGASAAKKC